MFKKLLILLSFAAAAASAKPVLTVYTYSSFNTQWGAGPGLKAAFEKVCDCEVKYVALDHGVMILNRLRQEGEQNGADVIIGIDNTLMQTALDTGLFAPSGVDTSKLKLPDGWTDPVFVPFDYGWFSFVYDKTRLKNPPRSLHELVESQEPWTVIYSDPRVSTPGQGFMLWMQKVFGDDAPAAWEKLAKKTVTVTKGSSEAYSLFSKGESDMALYYSTSPAYQLMKENEDIYAAALFDEGHYLQVEVAARTRTSKQPELAQKFLEFLITPAFQENIATTNWVYPAGDVTLPEAFAKLPRPAKTLQFTPDEVQKNRPQWIEQWQKAVSQ